MGSNEGHAWMSLGGVGHVEISEGFFGLTRTKEDPSLHLRIRFKSNKSCIYRWPSPHVAKRKYY